MYFRETLNVYRVDVTGWAQVDVSSEIQALADSGATWAAFTVRADDWWSGATVRASEYTDYSPNLNVVPEPAMLSLLGLGGIVLLGKRR